MQYREISEKNRKKVDEMLLLIESLYHREQTATIREIVQLDSFKDLCLQDDLFMADGTCVKNYVLEHLKKFNAIPKPKNKRRIVFDSCAPADRAKMAELNSAKNREKTINFFDKKQERNKATLWNFGKGKTPKAGGFANTEPTTKPKKASIFDLFKFRKK